MQNDSPASEIDINEAMELTGRTRDTLMRWKRANKVKARVVIEQVARAERRILFSREDVLKLAGQHPE